MRKNVAIGLGLAALLTGIWLLTTTPAGDRPDALTSDEEHFDAPGASQARKAPGEEIEDPDVNASEAEAVGVSAARTLPATLEEFMARLNDDELAPSYRSIFSSDIPEDNGAHYFMLAYEMRNEKEIESIAGKWWDLDSRFDYWMHPDFPESIKYFHPFFELFRQGLDVGNAMLPPTLHGPYEEADYVAFWRSLNVLMMNEARLFESQGDFDAALSHYMTVLEFDTESARGGMFIGALAGYQVNRDVWEGLEGLFNSGQIEAESYWSIIEQLGELEARSLTAPDLHAAEAENFDAWMSRQLQEGLTFEEILNSPETLLSDFPALSEEAYHEYFDEFLGHRQQMIEMSALPYYEAQEFDLAAMVEGNPFSQALLPSVWRVLEVSARNQVVMRAMTTMAALDWYRMEHSGYPPSLAALVPAYLPELPIDSYTGNPLIYRSSQGDYTLYSVGTDMEDNLGMHGRWTDEGTDMLFHPFPARE